MSVVVLTRFSPGRSPRTRLPARPRPRRRCGRSRAEPDHPSPEEGVRIAATSVADSRWAAVPALPRSAPLPFSGQIGTDGRRPLTTPGRRRTTGPAEPRGRGADPGRRSGQGWAMPRASRPRRQPTDDWDQLRLLVASPEQETYELLRPIVLFGQPTARPRPRDRRRPSAPCGARSPASTPPGCAASSSRTTRRPPDRRRLPLGIRRGHRRAEGRVPAASACARSPRICRHRFDRPVSHHTVEQVLATEPLPLHPPRRFPRYRDIPDPVARRKAVVDLYLEGWSATAIAGYLETSRPRVYETLRALGRGGLAGAGRPLARPRTTRPARSTSRRWRRSAGCRPTPSSASSASTPRWRSRASTSRPRTCGRILALHRALGAPQPGRGGAARAAADAVRRRSGGTSTGRSTSATSRTTQLGTGKPVYVDLDPGELQPGAPRQRDLAAPGPDRLPHRAAGGGRGARRAGGARQRRRRRLQGQPGPGDLRRPGHREASRSTRARPGRTTSRPTSTSCAAWPTTTTPGPRPGPSCRPSTTASSTTTTTSRTPPTGDRTDGRRSPAAVLGWVQGAWCDPADLDRLFRLRATRVLNAGGSVRFRHWRLYGERGLAGERAAVWVWRRDADHRVRDRDPGPVPGRLRGRRAPAAGGRRAAALRRPATPRRSRSCRRWRRSTWHPAQRLAPYRPRRTRRGAGRQERLVVPEPDAQAG